MSLFKRDASPYFYCEFEIEGRRVVRSSRKRSRREAEQFEKELREQVRKEIAAAPKQTIEVFTLDQACGRYWTEHGHKLADADNVQRWLRYVVSYMDPSLPLVDLNVAHVTQFVADLEAASIGPIAINRTLSALQGVHSRAAKKWLLPVNLINFAGQKNRETKRTRWITRAEAHALLAGLPNHIFEVVLFMLLTGCRKKEAFNLLCDDVNFDQRTATVIAKGSKLHTLQLNDEAVGLLLGLPDRGARCFDITNFRNHFARARDAAGIKDFTWHDLRHTFATWLGQSGASLEVIKEQLGHSDISVTQRYRHVNRAEVRDAMQKFPTVSPNTDNVVRLKQS